MRIDVPYCTVEDLKQYRDLDGAKDEQRLRQFCDTASKMFNAATRRVFYPRKETRNYDHPDPQVGARTLYERSLFSWRLKLDDDLLEVVTLTTENGSTTIPSTDYFLKCGDRYDLNPYDLIELKRDSGTTGFSFSGTPQKANAVTGYWGYHESWADAFLDSLDTVENTPNLSASATTLQVNGTRGADLWGYTPRFKVQQLLAIGTGNEREFLYVTGRNDAAQTLTVIRGVNGTTAQAHAQNSPIYIFYPMGDVVRACTRLADWLYAQKDNKADVIDRPIIAPSGMMILPADSPKDVQKAAIRYKRNYRGNR